MATPILQFITLYSSNPGMLCDFYRLLGVEFSSNKGLSFVHKSDNFELELYPSSDVTRKGTAMLGFEADDLDTILSRMPNVRRYREPRQIAGSYDVVLLDPDGRKVYLRQKE